MNPLLYAKSGDVTTWRAVEDFSAAYRQALLDRAASYLGGSTETVFSETASSIESAITTHRNLVMQLECLTEDVSTAAPSADLKEITFAFYSSLYQYFGIFRSAPAFYQLSMTFLLRASATIVARATEQLGPEAVTLPEIALFAVGPAGRSEYSPFSRLQLLLVHGNATGSQLQNIDRFCQALHAVFEAAGLAVDPVVTPRNAGWRGTVTEWEQRCTEEGLHPQVDVGIINLYRLVDQYPLFSADRPAREFKQSCSTALSASHSALANLIERMGALSNGLSLMGRLKLERSGSSRGLFRLIDLGLQPLSAALSALALVKKAGATGNCERIHDLLRRGELDVEQAERMLATWHTLHDLQLLREQSFQTIGHTNSTACLNPDELTAGQLQSLKEALESVAVIQRHVEIIFSGMGE
jgi:CBS domain-containing protein